MKHLIILLLALSGFTGHINGQSTREEEEIMVIVNAQDSITRDVFLDTLMLGSNMKKAVFNTRQVWYSMSDDPELISQLFDIRIKFASHDSAMYFHKKYLAANSEYGPEIKKHKIKYEGAEELRVYSASDFLNKMVEPYGLQMFCYLFVVNNYFVKVYISCKKKFKPDEFQDLITDIITRIKRQPHN